MPSQSLSQDAGFSFFYHQGGEMDSSQVYAGSLSRWLSIELSPYLGARAR